MTTYTITVKEDMDYYAGRVFKGAIRIDDGLYKGEYQCKDENDGTDLIFFADELSQIFAEENDELVSACSSPCGDIEIIKDAAGKYHIYQGGKVVQPNHDAEGIIRVLTGYLHNANETER